jgi:outer membrane protein TolC
MPFALLLRPAAARRRVSALVRFAAALALLTLPRSALAQQTFTLEQAIETAERQGLAAQAARSTLDAARWQDRAFGAQLLPQLSLTGTLPDVNRAIIPVVLPTGETEFVPQSQTESSLGLMLSQPVTLTGGKVFISSGLTRVDRNDTQESSRLWQSTPLIIGLQQDLFRPNTLAWDRREQSLRTEVAERQYVEAREDVALSTAQAFFNAYAARVALENASANVAVNDTLYTISKGRYQVGKIGENDLLQSELALLRARTALDGAKLEADRTLMALARLLNLPPSTTIDITPPTDIPTVEVDTAQAVAEALRNESQMSGFDLQAIQARRELNEARLTTGFGATVTASAGFNQTAPLLGDVYHSLLDQQQLTVSVQMPLVQWGGRHAKIEAARADQNAVAANARAAREAVAQDAYFAALQLAQSQRQLALSAKADTVGAKRFDVAKHRYLIGKIGIGDLYIAQSEKDAALQAYVQALQGYWTAYYQLRRITLYDFAKHRPLRARE